MDLFKTRSVEEVQKIIEELSEDLLLETEECLTMDALHRTLSESLKSPIDVPGFNRSTVDGYALKAADTYGASESMPAMLKDCGEVGMGEETIIILSAGECVYVPTGGMLPVGCDAVVMIEFSEKLDEKTVLIHQPVTIGANILKKGEDIGQNEIILNKGHRLRPQDLGLLSGMGFQTFLVFKKLKVGIISTGDEIIQPGDKLDPGKIIDMNTYSLSAAVKEDGCEVFETAVVPDDLESLKMKIKEMMKECQLVLISGGSSMGHHDVTKDAIDSMGEPGVVVHGMSVKPGKPTIIGKADKTILLGLPGQPVSTLVVYRILIRPLLKKRMNHKTLVPTIKGVLAENISSAPGREHYVMVRLEEGLEENRIWPVHGKSGMLSMMSRSQGYIKIEANQEGLSKGSDVEMEIF